MSLDFCLRRVQPTDVFDANITHNLGPMAREAGIYEALWRPDENPAFKTAADLIPVLQKGFDDLLARPEHFRQFNAPNGWGRYEHFVQFVADVLNACMEYPDAVPVVSR